MDFTEVGITFIKIDLENSFFDIKFYEYSDELEEYSYKLLRFEKIVSLSLGTYTLNGGIDGDFEISDLSCQKNGDLLNYTIMLSQGSGKPTTDIELSTETEYSILES